jgi:hypothetical protein
LGVDSVEPQHAAGGDLHDPAAVDQLERQLRLLDHRHRPLRMGKDRLKSGSMNVFRELDRARETRLARVREWAFNEHRLQLVESVPPRILLEELVRGTELEAESQLEATVKRSNHLGVCLPNARLALTSQRQIGTDVRSSIEDSGSASRRLSTEGDCLLDRLNAVVTGRDHVRMNVDETRWLAYRPVLHVISL